jgi:hypothetical protein
MNMNTHNRYHKLPKHHRRPIPLPRIPNRLPVLSVQELRDEVLRMVG